jgi:predicted MFS family arabinose efflux permease
MATSESVLDKPFKRYLILAVLILSFFVVMTFNYVLSTLLVEIAGTFKVSIGTASQIATVFRFVGLVIGFGLSLLAIRFKLKSLFVLGLGFFAVGILGSFFAPNFLSILILQAFLGTGFTMVTVLTVAMIGETLPLRERGFAVSLTFVAQFTANIFVPPISSSLIVFGSWRTVLLWFVFPLSVASIILSWFAIPSRLQAYSAKLQYKEAFKQILLKKSVLACLTNVALMTFPFVISTYAVSFYRMDFHQSLSTASLFSSIAAIAGLSGALIGGTIVNRIGRKSLAVSTAFVTGIFALTFSFVANVWFSVALLAVSTLSLAMSVTGLRNLTLEQVPGFRGSMMSVADMFRSIGFITGLGVSGLILNLYSNDFHLIMIMCGIAAIAASPILLLAKDPCKTT